MGDLTTEVTLVLANLFKAAGVPLVSYGAQGSALSSFPLFLRTVATASERAEVNKTFYALLQACYQ